VQEMRWRHPMDRPRLLFAVRDPRSGRRWDVSCVSLPEVRVRICTLRGRVRGPSTRGGENVQADGRTPRGPSACRADGRRCACARRRRRHVGPFNTSVGGISRIQSGRGACSPTGTLAPVAGPSTPYQTAGHPRLGRALQGAAKGKPPPCIHREAADRRERRARRRHLHHRRHGRRVRQGPQAGRRPRGLGRHLRPGHLTSFGPFPPPVRGGRIGSGSTRVCGCG